MAVVALAVVIVLCLVAGVVGLFTISRDDDRLASLAPDTPSTQPTRPSTAPTTAPPTSGPAAPAPPSSSTPSTAPPSTAPPITQAELEAVVSELQAFVEAARELTFLTPVVVELLDDAAFEQRLLADFDESIDDIEKLEVAYRALGIIDEETSLLDLLKRFLGVGVLGFYDPETGELVVRGVSASLYVKSTIVHELVHALDDQHFELDRPEYDDRPDEIGTGFSAVVEGNARRVENEWTATLSDDEQDALRAEQQAVSDGIDFSDYPDLIVNQLLAPYQLGERLVEAILRRNDERGVDAALVAPPDTTEQVLFSDKYFEAESRIEVPAPSFDGEQVDEGVVGALFWFLLMTSGDSSVNPSDAIRAVDGWGGDWYVTYLADEQPCFVADVDADTAADLDEFEQMIGIWAQSQGAASVERIDDRVRVDSCSASSGVENPDV